MSFGTRFFALLFSFSATAAHAHPGPHSHTSIDATTPHAWLGWEAALTLTVIAAGLVLWRRGRAR